MAETITIESDDEVEFRNTANTIPFDFLDDTATYFAKRSKRDNVVGSWMRCKVLKRVENIGSHKVYVVEFSNDRTKKDVASYELAKHVVPTDNELKKGTRVIAARRNEELPYKLNEIGGKIELYSSTPYEFYPGILAMFHTDGRYLVFFDDGMVQYVPKSNIRRVLGNDAHNHAHWNAKSYFDFFLNKNQWEVKLSDEHKRLQIELNGKLTVAKIEKIDGSLGLFHFEAVNRFEWIYLGSLRISNIYRQHIKKKSLDNEIEFKTYQTCLSACDDIAVIDLLEPDDDVQEQQLPLDVLSDLNVNRKQQRTVKHDCGPECVRLNGKPNEMNTNIERHAALQRPLMIGWSRSVKKTRYYRTPCGIKLYSYSEIDKYLMKTNSKLRMDCFDLSKSVAMLTISTDDTKVTDLSRGKEKIPIAVRGEKIHLDFNYITDHNLEYIDIEPKNNLGRSGCNCKDNCRDKLQCSCWQMTVQFMKQRTLKKYEYKRYAGIGYKNMKLTELVPSGIVECGSSCKCCADKCVNHVVQNGVQHRLEVFKTETKGWGVRTKTDLPEGAFICHYAGDLLEITAADQRDSKYQFKLPKLKPNSNSDVESDSNSDNDIELDDEPAAKIARNDDVVQPFLNYFPPMQNGNADMFPEPEYIESNEELKTFVVDGLKNGNISRYVNHSCEPNLLTQRVYASDDKRFPLIALFTQKIIKANEELTIDYGYEKNDARRLDCRCRAINCRGRLI